MPNPNELTAAGAARAIAERRLTAVELAEACLNRIEALDDRLLAWVYVDRDAVLADARAADAARPVRHVERLLLLLSRRLSSDLQQRVLLLVLL